MEEQHAVHTVALSRASEASSNMRSLRASGCEGEAVTKADTCCCSSATTPGRCSRVTGLDVSRFITASSRYLNKHKFIISFIVWNTLNNMVCLLSFLFMGQTGEPTLVSILLSYLICWCSHTVQTSVTYNYVHHSNKVGFGLSHLCLSCVSLDISAASCWTNDSSTCCLSWQGGPNTSEGSADLQAVTTRDRSEADKASWKAPFTSPDEIMFCTWDICICESNVRNINLWN